MARTIRLTLFWTQAAVKAKPEGNISVGDLAERYVSGARSRFKYYGLDLQTYPDSSKPEGGLILPFDRPICTPEDDLAVRRLCHAKVPSRPGVPVIFTTLNEQKRNPHFDTIREWEGKENDWSADWAPKGCWVETKEAPLKINGWVPDEEVVTKEWIPFVFVNVARFSSPGMVIAHELGHCAGLDHHPSSNNLMYYGDWFTAVQLEQDQQKAIRDAFFVYDA